MGPVHAQPQAGVCSVLLWGIPAPTPLGPTGRAAPGPVCAHLQAHVPSVSLQGFLVSVLAGSHYGGMWALCVLSPRPVGTLGHCRKSWRQCQPAFLCTLPVGPGTFPVLLPGTGPVDGSREQSGTTGSPVGTSGYG